ncbi:MAG: hypothetical protein EOP12_04005, partial [Pseudomonas sp.]
MTEKIVITSDRTAQVTDLETGSEFILNKGVTLSTAATAIVATGVATQRDFYINGTVLSASSYAFQFGTTAVTDSQSQFVVGASGVVNG